MWSTQNPFLQGPYEPLDKEYVLENLQVDGEIPAALNGTLYRTGSNQHFRPLDVEHFHWFDGDGMVHAFKLEDGKASYCNRMVETDGLKVELAAGKALYNGISGHSSVPQPKLPDGAPLFKNVAGINVIAIGNRVLTMHEVDHFYWELDGENLKTLGKFDFGDHPGAMLTAHPHTDARASEILFYSHDNEDQTLDCFATDMQGEVLSRHRVALPFKPWIHDFIFTENFYVFTFGGIRIRPFAPNRAEMGRSSLSFDNEATTRLLLVDRHTGQTRWFGSEKFFTLGHYLNAHEASGKVIIDASVTRTINPGFKGNVENFYPFPLVNEPTPFSDPELHRITIDLLSGQVSDTRVGEFNAEFPRPNEIIMGTAQRYGYMVGIHAPGPQTRGFNCLIKHDYQTNSSSFQHLSSGFDMIPGEPIFVTKPNATEEDNGWIMSVWWNPMSNTSEMVIQDAQDFDGKPLARIKLDHRVPLGFHGNWIAHN